MTIEEFAKTVGVSVYVIRHQLKAGKFAPAVPGIRGRGQRSFFSREQIAEYKELSIVNFMTGGVRSFGSEDAKNCFKAFREGKTIETIVIEHGLHPETVRAIRTEWIRTRTHDGQALHIPASILAQINDLGLDGPVIETPEDLLLAIRETLNEHGRTLVAKRACRVCKTGERVVCANCVSERMNEAKAQARKEAETRPRQRRQPRSSRLAIKDSSSFEEFTKLLADTVARTDLSAELKAKLLDRAFGELSSEAALQVRANWKALDAERAAVLSALVPSLLQERP